jgi:hypothetical protein
VEEARRNISAEVLDFRQGLAAVLVKSAQFYEFLLLAKIEGVWKIVNVLWTNKVASSQRTASEIEAVREAVRKCALDYMDGYYSGDLDRVVRAIHPELTKVAPMAMPQTRRMMLGKQGASLVIEATRAKLSALDEAKRNIEIEVLGLHEGLALVRVLSAISYEYLQMANLGPDWQIINILWTTNPSAPKPAQK